MISVKIKERMKISHIMVFVHSSHFFEVFFTAAENSRHSLVLRFCGDKNKTVLRVVRPHLLAT